MTKSVKLNIARYVVSIVLPLCCLSINVYAALVMTLVLLLLNNVLDDYSFYYANGEAAGSKMSAVSSPVNGIITQIERGVPLFSHIKKVDVLTKEECFELEQLSNRYDKKHERWNHVTIFLDKFSHHVVVNPGQVRSIQRIFADGRLEEMVLDGNLLANNVGSYVGNRAVVIEYDNMIAVLTLDKYVSRYAIDSYSQGNVGLIILRGSQCDLYSKRELEHYAHAKGDIVQIGDPMFKAASYDSSVYASYLSLYKAMRVALKDIGGAKQIWKSNAKKTLATFRNMFLLVTVVVGVSLSYLSQPLAYVAFSSVYLFVFDRFYRHLMYALMNARGYKPWMTKTYRIIHKISVLWKK